MDLEQQFDFDELVNEAERLVLAELGSQLEHAPANVPRDEEHVLDMAAYALNHVKPMYRVNLLGRLYARQLEAEYGAEIRSAVSQAIQIVSKNRR